MRVLVTGAAGFLGSNLCDRFLRDGHSVVGVDNFVTGHPDNLAHLRNEPRFAFEEGDVSEGLPPSLGKLDGILHLASPASPPDYQRVQIATMRVNSLGSINCLELAQANGARYFVASTSEVYGDPHVHPQPESYWGNVNPIGPRSMYDEAKRFAEAVAMAYNRERGVDTRIVRIFNTYGPRMRPRDGRVVSNFIVQALSGEPLTVYGDGTQTRSFCYVDDEVEGLYRLFLYDGEGKHEPCNIGNPGEYTMLELAQIVKDVTGTESSIVHRPLPADDPKQRRPDISRARRLLGWEPRVPVREGIERTAAYFRSLLAAGRTLD